MVHHFSNSLPAIHQQVHFAASNIGGLPAFVIDFIDPSSGLVFAWISLKIHCDRSSFYLIGPLQLLKGARNKGKYGVTLLNNIVYRMGIMKNNFREFALNVIDELGLSDYEVAKLTGIKSSSVSRWRTGKTVPRKNSLRHLAQLANKQVHFRKTDDTVLVEWAEDASSPLTPYVPLQNIRQTVKVYTWSQVKEPNFYRRRGGISVKPVHALSGIPDVEDPLAYSVIVDEEQNPLVDPYTRYGDVMIVSPAASVKNGDHVIAKLADGRVISRKVQFAEENLYFTRHEGGVADFSVKSEAVSFYHKVVYVRKR